MPAGPRKPQRTSPLARRPDRLSVPIRTPRTVASSAEEESHAPPVVPKQPTRATATSPSRPSSSAQTAFSTFTSTTRPGSLRLIIPATSI